MTMTTMARPRATRRFGPRGALAAMRAAFATAALAFATAAGAHGDGGHDHAAMKAGGKAPRPGLAASAAFDAKGRLWAVYVENDHVTVRSTTDLGKTWSAPVRVNAVPEKVESDGDSRPRIAAGPGDLVYVTWTKPLAKPYTGEIRFARSADGGRTFSTPRPVHADRQEITHRFDSIAVGSDGRVFVAWIDKRDLVAAGGKAAKGAPPAYEGAAVYYAVSDDRGASFRGDFRAAEHSCECCRIAMVPQPDGSMLALWRHVFDGGIRDHALARLGPDGAAKDFRRATFDGWKIDACPHHGPSLAQDARGRLHAVWFSDAPGRSGAFYGRLESGSVAGQRRIGGDTAEHADLAIAGDRVAIVWKEFDGQRSTLRALVSDANGENFAPRELASTDDASDQPRLLTKDGGFVAFWNTRRAPLSVYTLP